MNDFCIALDKNKKGYLNVYSIVSLYENKTMGTD